MIEQQDNFDQMQTQQSVGIQPEQDNGKRKRQKMIVLILAILCTLMAVIVGVLFFGMYGKGSRIQAKLDLGNQYLDEMKYEEALAEFESILEIMPDNPDAYLGIVEVYIRQGEFDTALEYAQEGYEITEDEHLQEKVDMILSGDIFDSRGLQMKMSHYEDGVLKWWHQYTYNNEGNMTSVTLYGADGKELGKVELEYDADGNELVTYVDQGGTAKLDRSEKTYEDGKCVRDVWYTLDGEWICDYRYEYEGDRLKKESIMDEQGMEIGYWLYEYNEQGLVSKKTGYYTDEGEGKACDYSIWKYDQNGNEIENCRYMLDPERGEYILDWREVSEYDDEGNCIGRKQYDGDGNLEWEKTYD